MNNARYFYDVGQSDLPLQLCCGFSLRHGGELQFFLNIELHASRGVQYEVSQTAVKVITVASLPRIGIRTQMLFRMMHQRPYYQDE
jgi:hypothetical protein